MLGAYETITIWNKWRDPATKKDVWYRRVVCGCSWECKIAQNASGTGAVVASTFRVLISENASYLPYGEWAALPESGKRTHFTLGNGDLVALGNVATEITGEPPYTESMVEVSLRPNAFNIEAVIDRSQGYKEGRHYEIAGV